MNVESEAPKSHDCEFWLDREAFLSQFCLEVNDDDTERQLKELLWNYRHVFMNKKYPHQFHEGIRVPTITIPLKPNPPPPRTERPRRLNEAKLQHLKDHIRTMMEQGIMKEHNDIDGGFSPAPSI